ncbi:MAG: c-type cytochrome [Deltaproteobacteria bacterium]|nr:c-type cytochrome [Deltaproteobacteria bacterium]
MGEADMIFNTRCATCHGPQGKGDGAAAAALNPKPRSFADAEWQKTVTDEHIGTVIVKGGAAAGKSPLMAPNPDLEAKPEVVKALVARVRKLGGS